MFPDLCGDASTHPPPPSRSSIVTSLSEPSQLLTTAVIELLSLQDETELTTKAIPELVKLLSDKDETVVMRAVHMVHMLSRERKSVNAIASNPTLVDALCTATRYENDAIRRDALGALSHISERAEGRMHIFRSGGIPELVRMLGIPVDAVRALNVLGDFIHNVDDRTQFAVLCAVRNLSDAATNEDSLGPLIISLIEVVAAGEESTTACAAGVLSNLTCNNIRNKQTLCTNRLETTARGESVVTLAMDVLGRAGVQLRQDPDALADGVAMRELVEGAVSALHQLGNDLQSAQLMLRDHPFIDMLVKLLSWEEVYANDDELLQRELLGLLYQLSKTPEGARQLDMYGPAPVLAEALHSKHKAISTYASGVLKNLQFDKPLIYREEIDTEIESAMNGVAGYY
ncbi:unnamed protein product [Gongylonema pulchrum]|uniref:Arm_2 domain-containing protein n=1 Tax=Gongylonema pulchrum TaxID=637853 RepID=A0A183DYB2_9BILA|nr:unnamed protein product [Gongylonema pulchrum]